jgi:predicted kinase
MLYLVGGCSRSGKSLLAERMRAKHGIPWFSLDALKMGLFHGAPTLGIDPNADDLLTADQLSPIVRGATSTSCSRWPQLLG